MKKTIRKIGTSIGIIFNKEEAKNYKLKIGDVLDLSDIVKVKHNLIKIKNKRKKK